MKGGWCLTRLLLPLSLFAQTDAVKERANTGVQQVLH